MKVPSLFRTKTASITDEKPNKIKKLKRGSRLNKIIKTCASVLDTENDKSEMIDKDRRK